MNANQKKIILTRPVAQAQPLAKRLGALGYRVTLFPLLEIASLPEKSELQIKLQATINHLSQFAMAAFVSPNAIHAVFKHGVQWPPGVSIAVMGEGSRAVLAQYGINEANTPVYCPADPFRSDSEALLHELNLNALKGKDVVIFRAETGRELLSKALTAQGINVIPVVSYRRSAPPVTAQSSLLLSELSEQDCIWIVSSSEALRTLADMARKLVNVIDFQQMNLWVSHHRIAQTAEKCGFKRISLVGSGDENLLLALQSQPLISPTVNYL